ncbi:MAG: hypothetical protein ACR2MX_18890, partial [Cyclobacteriaceae bacterium]
RKNDIKSMGWWAVDVAEAGSYQMTFYRWPSHLQVPITSPLEGTEAVPNTNSNGYPQGASLNIKQASLQIGDYSETKPVTSQDIGITFELNLARGTNQVRAWFTDETEDPFAPNYIEVKKL